MAELIHKIIYVTFLSIYGNFSCNSNGRRNIKFLYCLAMKIALNNKSFLTCVCLDKKTTLMENTLGYMLLYQIIQYNRNIKLLELHNYYGEIVIFFFNLQYDTFSLKYKLLIPHSFPSSKLYKNEYIFYNYNVVITALQIKND